MSNKQFKLLLNQIEQGIGDAQCTDDLIKTISLVKSYEGPLKFDNSIPYALATILFLFGVFIFVNVFYLDGTLGNLYTDWGGSHWVL